MERWAMWVAGALFSVTYALIWRLHDMNDAREEYARTVLQDVRNEIATVRLEVLRELTESDREFMQRVGAIEKELAQMNQRQQLDEDRWSRSRGGR